MTHLILIQCLTPTLLQVLNVVTDLSIDVQPLIMTLRLLIIVPGTWNQYTAFGTSFMFPESGSWRLTRKCRCLSTAGKCNNNFTHTSSYESA